nr:hypothetical protein [Tanacetum cinerariifolium]
TQDPLALMANFNNPYAFPAPHQDQSSFNQNYLQQPMPNPEDITDSTTAMNMRISSNLRNRQIAQPNMNLGQYRQMQMVGGNGGNQFRQYAGQSAGNLTGTPVYDSDGLAEGYVYSIICVIDWIGWVRLPSICVIIRADGYAYPGRKVMRTLASVEIEIISILGLTCCLSSSSSMRCLENDPYEAIRQAYLVGTYTESEPFEDHVKTKTSESPHIVAPPTCHVEESEGSGTSSVRSTSSDSIAPLLPDHPLTHTTPILVPSLCRTARMAVHVQPVMSPIFSENIAEVAAMPDSAFRKRFRSFYDSSPSPTFPVWKRYRGTSELILDTDSEGDVLGDEDDEEEEDEEVEESSDSNSESEDAKDEGPTAEEEDLAVGDERAALVVETAMGEPLGLGQGSGSMLEPERPEGVPALRNPTLTTWIDLEDGRIYIDVPAYPPPAPPVQTPSSPEWLSGSLPISPVPFVVPLPISSPLISLTVPSSIASPATAEGFLAELGGQVEMQGGLIRDHMVRLGELSPALFERYDRDIGELFTRSGAIKDEIFFERYRLRDISQAGYDDHRLVHDMLLHQVALQRELQEMRGRVTALEQERDHRER